MSRHYLKNFKLLNANGRTIVDASESNISVTEAGYVYTYIVPIEGVLQTASADETYSFVVPIEFEPYSGKNVQFEGKTKAGENEEDPPVAEDMQYSNYRVNVEMGLLETATSADYLANSNDKDFIVYTNARIRSDIITPVS